MNEKTKKSKTTVKDYISVALQVVVFSILAIYSLSIILILLWGLLSSFKSTLGFNLEPLAFPSVKVLEDANINWPDAYKDIKGYNFVRAIKLFQNLKINDASYYSPLFGDISKPGSNSVNFMFAVFNTLMYAGVCSFVASFTHMIVAYFCAKYKYLFSKIIYVTVTVIMVIPIVGNQTSMVSFMQLFGLYDSYLGMILQKMSFTGMYFLVFFGFYQGFSDSYVEAAEIDGASQMGIFFKIVMPLSIKMLMTVFIIYFVAAWNDYQTPYMYFPTKTTLSYAIFSIVNTNQNANTAFTGMEWTGAPQKIAASMLFAAPIIIFYMFFNKVLLGDLSMGGLKE